MSRIFGAGGFVAASSIAGDAAGYCAVCGFSIDYLGWVHVASMQAVCRGCLRDPREDDGEAGLAAAAKLAALDERERVREGEAVI